MFKFVHEIIMQCLNMINCFKPKIS